MSLDPPLPSARPQSPPKGRGGPHSRSLRWGGLAVLLLVLAVVAYKTVYPAIKVRRGRDHAQQVERLGRLGDLDAAMAQLRLALHFAPQDTKVLRVAARFCDRLRLAQGLTYHELLLARPDATAADRRSYAEAALNLGRLDLAGQQLSDLLRASPKDLDLLHLLVRQQRAARDFERALKTARHALALQPEDERSQLVLGRCLLERRADAQLRAEGRRLLWGLAVGDGPHHDPAIDLLVGSLELTKGERELLARFVAARPGQRFRDQLVLADLRLLNEPGRSNALVAEIVRALWPLAGTNGLLALGSWANQRGGSAALLALLPAESARTDRLLLPLRAIALADTGDWDGLAQVLNESAGPLGPFFTASLKGRLALARDRRPEAEEHLRSAVELPGLTVTQVRFIAREAERAGFTSLAIQAWQRMLADPEETVTASLQIFRLLQPLDDFPLVLATIKRLNEFIPGDDHVAGERAWLELLSQQNLDFGRSTAARLRQKYPQEPQWRHLAALAELRASRPEVALPLVEPELVRWAQLSPRWQLVTVMALGENQHREAARGYARKIDAKKLRSVERQLLAPWL